MKALHISHSSSALRDYLDESNTVHIFPPVGKLHIPSNTSRPVKATTKAGAERAIMRVLCPKTKAMIKQGTFNLVVFKMAADSENNTSGLDFWCYSVGGQKRD